MTYSEDCLYIDVYTPANATSPSGKGLPVMLWIQGGAFITLINPDYNGTGLIEASGEDMVVVSFNYRVGPFGFLASDELREEGNLNVGLHDQRAAMRWVQDNIAKFGGDPDSITLFGASVGGGSVILQSLAYNGHPSPEEDIKWRAGIGEAVYIPTVNKVEDVENRFTELLSATGCDNLACLRALDSETIQEANIDRPFPGQSTAPLFPYNPVIDGALLTDTPYAMLAAGHFAKERPLILGSSNTEGTLFVPQANTTKEVNAFLKAQFPLLTNKDLTKANKLYKDVPQTMPGVTVPASPYFYRLATMYGDASFLCPSIDFATGFSNKGVEAHLFRDNIRDPTEVAAGFIVPHTWEIQAVWGPEYATQYVAAPGADSYELGGFNHAIVSTVQGYWTSFARTGGDPNMFKQSHAPVWKRLGDSRTSSRICGTSGDVTRLRLETNATAMETVPKLDLQRCAFWKDVRAQGRL